MMLTCLRGWRSVHHRVAPVIRSASLSTVHNSRTELYSETLDSGDSFEAVSSLVQLVDR